MVVRRERRDGRGYGERMMVCKVSCNVFVLD